MPKRNRNRLALCILLGALMLSLTACEQPLREKGQEVVLTTGFEEGEVIRYCTGDEAHTASIRDGELSFYIAMLCEDYAHTFGRDVLRLSNGDFSILEYVWQDALTGLGTLKTKYLFALNEGFTITDDMRTEAEEEARSYMASLTQEELTSLPVSKEELTALLCEYKLGRKAYDSVTAEVDFEISDDDARSVSVQWIYIPTYTVNGAGDRVEYSELALSKAEDAIQEAGAAVLEGEDFFSVMSLYSKDTAETRTVRKGDVEELLEYCIFSLKRGEVSDVIKNRDGYYIVKCLVPMDEESTRKNRADILKKAQNDFYNERFADFTAQVTEYGEALKREDFVRGILLPHQILIEY